MGTLKVTLISTLLLAAAASVQAAEVKWVDWTSGTAGDTGSATGSLLMSSTTVNVSYTGEIAFLLTDNLGDNYWAPTTPFVSPLVDNAPPTTDIIALQYTGPHTLDFSQPIDNLFLAFVSLNQNGWEFDSDFELVSQGTGYWGSGTVEKKIVNGKYQLNATNMDPSNEPHGVIRFTGPVSSLKWTSLTAEYWNGFTVGTYGAVPEPGTWLAGGLGVLLTGIGAWRRRQA